MAYRDPELSRMAGELLQEKTKVLILEEENRQLKAMIKAEVGQEPEHIIPPPGVLSIWRNFSCNWLGNHSYLVEADEATILKGMRDFEKVFEADGCGSLCQPKKFDRSEFFRFCRIYCKHCGRTEKEIHQPLRETSLGTFVELVALFNPVFEEFRDSHPELFRA